MPMHGVVPSDKGVEVAIPASSAESVELCVFDERGETRHELEGGDDGVYRAQIPSMAPGTTYGLRTHGPWDPRGGLRHHPNRLLVDPFARAVSGVYVDHPSLHDDAPPGGDTAPYVPRGVVVGPPDPPRPGPAVPWEDMVVYETHVRGMTTTHPEVPEHLRGTYLGLASEPIIEHLLELGVTTVELLPVAHHVTEPFLQERGRTNYWGYSTLAWFAPHGGYATGDDGRQVAEFAAMVDRLHAAGIEVIVDVVFNHTAEGGATGPVLSMKGLDNGAWYRLDPEDQGTYVDWTGTGNTVDTSSDVVRAAVVDSLRWWAEGLGVDGFRFDLAVTLGREHGPFAATSLAWIAGDPVLGTRKLIAEPWDLGPDGYQLGGFGAGWAEWNDRFRDDLRDVWRGRGTRGGLATRLAGSPDLFAGRGPTGSVNFVTAHDGFTLADLVAYDHKHNGSNGEENQDGHDDNRSWNSGAEGPTDDPAIAETRRRRSAAIVASLLLARGVPMILGGDELGRTQRGNNNAYAVDDPLTWFDWSRRPLTDLVAAVTAVRRRHPSLRSPEFADDLRWLGTHGEPATTWDEHGPLVLESVDPSDRLAVLFNPTAHDTSFHLPEGPWSLELLTCDLETVGPLGGESFVAPAWSVTVLTLAPRGAAHISTT